MFAIIKTGGKQYRVEKGTKLKVEKLSDKEGAAVLFDEVLLVDDGKKTIVGQPTVQGAKVMATVKSQGRSKKVIVFKYKSKTRQSTKTGHRQQYTEVEVTDIKA
jgi:large subunit ribosomal protein L21